MKKKQLIEVARELNKVLGLDPKIDVDEEDTGLLIADVKKAWALVEEGDKISDETKKAMKELNKLPGGGSTSQPTAQRKEAVEEGDEEKEVESIEKKEVSTKKKKSARNGTPSISNKGKVWLEWKKGVHEVDILKKVCHSEIKESTIKAWGNEWGKGKNLPLIARKK